LLDACELDADRALTRWLARRRPAVAAILQRGTILERRDIDPFLDLALPGVDELLGLLEVERLAGHATDDCVVVDTAPTRGGASDQRACRKRLRLASGSISCPHSVRARRLERPVTKT
jgi:hypothetical protein